MEEAGCREGVWALRMTRITFQFRDKDTCIYAEFSEGQVKN